MLELPGGSRRYLQIARLLAADIDNARYAAGERLPPERELAQTLDVSRTTVREALLALEIMRYIEIRVGAGVYVLDEKVRARTADAEPDSAAPSEVLAARRIVEAETAALAAAHATRAQIDRMRDANDTMAGVGVGGFVQTVGGTHRCQLTAKRVEFLSQPVEHPVDLAGLVAAQRLGELHRVDIGTGDARGG